MFKQFQHFFCSKQPIKPAGGIPFLSMVLVGCMPSPCKRLYYRLKGAKIGKNVSFGFCSFIQSPQLEMADGSSVSAFVFIRTKGACKFGKRSGVSSFSIIDIGHFEMGEDSKIGEQVVVGGVLTPRSSLVIGERSKVIAFCVLNPTEAIMIGNDVGIGGRSYLFTHGTWQSLLDGYPGKFGDITIENGAWIGWDSFIMPDVVIGEYATVGACALVNNNIPAHSLAVGKPARVIKTDKQRLVHYSDDEKHTMVMGWIKEFSDYLNFIGYSALFDNIGSDLSIQINMGSHTEYRLIYKKDVGDGNEPEDMRWLISLAAIPQENRQILKEKSCIWFDIQSRECAYNIHPITDILYEFWKRYGLRFKIIE